MRAIGEKQFNPKNLLMSPELEEVQHVMPMSDTDRKQLKSDIKKHGMRHPIIVYNKGGVNYVLAGWNRREIAIELNMPLVDIQIMEGDTPGEFKLFVVTENLSRRHLTTDQKKKIAELFFKITPEASANQIAKKTGLDDKTAGKVKRDLQARSEIPNVETIDTKGRRQPEKKPSDSDNQTLQGAPVEARNHPPAVTTLDRVNKIKNLIEHELYKLDKDEADKVCIDILNYLRRRK